MGGLYENQCARGHVYVVVLRRFYREGGPAFVSCITPGYILGHIRSVSTTTKALLFKNLKHAVREVRFLKTRKLVRWDFRKGVEFCPLFAMPSTERARALTLGSPCRRAGCPMLFCLRHRRDFRRPHSPNRGNPSTRENSTATVARRGAVDESRK